MSIILTVVLVDDRIWLTVDKDKRFWRANFPILFASKLEIRQYIGVSRLQDTENFASYKTASHLKKRKIRGFFGAVDEARLAPCKDNKP